MAASSSGESDANLTFGGASPDAAYHQLLLGKADDGVRVPASPNGTTRRHAARPKLADIVGLYVDPPAHAVVFSLDEKSQIQALDRTQPGLPIKAGRCQTITHD